MTVRLPMYPKKLALLVAVFGTFALSGHAAFAASSSSVHMSNNWAGYAATDDTYTGVSATWAVPDSTETNSAISADAAWVGIGGISDDDLIQVGTQAVIRNDATEYTAWYELLPDTQQTIPLAVQPGDHIFASVNEAATGRWRITIVDLTTNQAYQTTVDYDSSKSSAEWVVERPLAITGDATGYLPLSDFGSVTFQNVTLTTESGKTETLDASDAGQLVMGSNGTQVLAAPDTESGNAFTVSYLSPSQSSKYLRAFRRSYTLQPQTNVSSRTPHYQEIDTQYVIHILFGGAR